MSRTPRNRWLRYGVALILLAIVGVGITRAPLADQPGHRPPADALATPSRHLPSPFLAATGLAIELPATELGAKGPQSGQSTRSTDPISTATRSISTAASRNRVIQLLHDTFAADNLAARAGLLSSRTTAPPPHLG